MNYYKYIVNLEQVATDDTQGLKIWFLSLIYFTILVNMQMGRHLSFGGGIGPFEASLQLSIWYGNK